MGDYKGPFVFFDIIFKSNNSIIHRVSSLLGLGKDTTLGKRKMVQEITPSLVIPVANNRKFNDRMDI